MVLLVNTFQGPFRLPSCRYLNDDRGDMRLVSLEEAYDTRRDSIGQILHNKVAIYWSVRLKLEASRWLGLFLTDGRHYKR